MYNVYTKFSSWISSVSAVLGSVAAVYLKEYLESQVNSRFFVLVSVVLVAMLVFMLASKLTELCIKHAPFIKYLVLGKDHILGTWVDVVFSADDRVVGAGIIHIEHDGSHFMVSGENYTVAEGSICRSGTFRSMIASYHNECLEFSYYSNHRFRQLDVPGYARYEFLKSGGLLPQYYDGYFFSSENKEKVATKARRLTHRERRSLLRQPDTKIELLQQAIQHFVNQVKTQEK